MGIFVHIAASWYSPPLDVQSITQTAKKKKIEYIYSLPVLYSNPFILNVFPRISIFSLVRVKRSFLADVPKVSVEY